VDRLKKRKDMFLFLLSSSMALHDMGWEFCFREITFIVSLIETKQKIDQTKSKNNLITKKA
jgi:hypothetical protein